MDTVLVYQDSSKNSEHANFMMPTLPLMPLGVKKLRH